VMPRSPSVCFAEKGFEVLEPFLPRPRAAFITRCQLALPSTRRSGARLLTRTSSGGIPTVRALCHARFVE